jgi:hypothetical protein
MNTTGFNRTREYGIYTGTVWQVTGAVCEKTPAVWPVLHPNWDNDKRESEVQW